LFVVDQSSQQVHVRLSPAARCFLALLGGGLLLALVIAACLQPDPRGFGTHEHLGLPPCTFSTWFGLRCPFCGMTTAWAHTLRGQLAAAVAANAGGPLLALAAMLAGPWMLASAIRGRPVLGRPSDLLLATAGLAVTAVILIDWLRRILPG
jgi:hypothetical protein